MTRTSSQQMADAHEDDMAEWIDGGRTKGSGNQWHAQMDAVNGTRDTVIPLAGDGKATRAKSISVTREMWAKAVEQAGPVRQPFLALRWYADEPNMLRVEQDLVAISPELFRRLLHGARQWEEQQAVEDAALGDFEQALLDLEVVDGVPCEATGCDCCR